MNKAVKAWQRHEARPKYTGPDGLALEGEKITMADRKPMPGQSVALTQTQLKGVITRLKEWPLDRVLQVRTGTFNALKRLGVARDTSRNWKGNPDGSRQGDIGTLLTWLDSIQEGDEIAIGQLVIIDATACERGT